VGALDPVARIGLRPGHTLQSMPEL